MAMTDNTTALEALRDQTAALPSAAKSVAGVAFGDSGATGDYAVSGEWLDNTATQIQSLTGATGGLTTTQMTEQLGTEYANVQNALATLAAKGVTVPDGANSNDLVELIAAIEAGGGASEQQIATGSFIPSIRDICSTPISVTGIGFTPKQVFVTLDAHSGGSIGFHSTASRVLVAISVGDIHSREVYASNVPGYGSKATGTYYSATIISDGFVIASNNAAYQICNGHGYIYVAIG